jgi:L-rhamnose mutarotase
MKRFCFALDLKDDPKLIAVYEEYHRAVWPEILKSIEDSGILQLEIYRTGNRMFMIMETTDAFSLDAKGKADRDNPKVQEWEALMWKYQQALPNARPGEKWRMMDKIFGWDSGRSGPSSV